MESESFDLVVGTIPTTKVVWITSPTYDAESGSDSSSSTDSDLDIEHSLGISEIRFEDGFRELQFDIFSEASDRRYMEEECESLLTGKGFQQPLVIGIQRPFKSW
jgi:hypothetical protein